MIRAVNMNGTCATNSQICVGAVPEIILGGGSAAGTFLPCGGVFC